MEEAMAEEKSILSCVDDDNDAIEEGRLGRYYMRRLQQQHCRCVAKQDRTKV